MHGVDIDMIRLQSVQAVLTGPDQVIAFSMRRSGLIPR